MKKTRPSNIKTIPVYARAGSIIPFGPDVQYATEKPWYSLNIAVYPGADASFTLYEDENDNYNYERGAYSTIDFEWNDKAKTLTIKMRKGSFPGMLVSRRFNVVKTSETGYTAPVTVEYDGTEKIVKL